MFRKADPVAFLLRMLRRPVVSSTTASTVILASFRFARSAAVSKSDTVAIESWPATTNRSLNLFITAPFHDASLTILNTRYIIRVTVYVFQAKKRGGTT